MTAWCVGHLLCPTEPVEGEEQCAWHLEDEKRAESLARAMRDTMHLRKQKGGNSDGE